MGIYLQDQVDLLPNLIVLAGVRFDYVDQFRTTQNLGEPREEFKQTDSDFTSRFGIVYKPIEPLSVYASYTTSYNPAFGASRNADDSTFDPETGRQFEIGVKADINQDLSFTFAVFDIRKQNVETTDPENPLFTIQTGEQASRGIEMDLTGEILPVGILPQPILTWMHLSAKTTPILSIMSYLVSPKVSLVFGLPTIFSKVAWRVWDLVWDL